MIMQWKLPFIITRLQPHQIDYTKKKNLTLHNGIDHKLSPPYHSDRASPPYKQVKHLLETSKKFKKLIAKKGSKFKKKNTHRSQFKGILE